MTPINFNLYEELPEPVFLQMQRKEAEEKVRIQSFFSTERKDRFIFNSIQILNLEENPKERGKIQKIINDLIKHDDNLIKDIQEKIDYTKKQD